MKNKGVILLLLILLSLNSEAQNSNRKAELSYLGFNPFNRLSDNAIANDIDKILLKCLDTSGGTNSGDIKCYDDATELTKKRISAIYWKLYIKLDSKDRILLKASQAKWNNYFKAEKDFVYSTFHTWSNVQKYGHGMEHSIAEAQWLFQIARQRLIVLRTFNTEVYEPENKTLNGK